MPVDLGFLDKARWINEPPEWAHDDTGLTLTTAGKTDFWRQTFYGFEPHTGHFFGAPVAGDFTAYLTFEAAYETLYDQAGLMLRIDDEHWIKAGIEFSDGAANFSVVVARGRSDWSAVRVADVSGLQTLRMTRIADAVLVHFRDAGGGWQFLRLADFAPPGEAALGPMACTPQRAGLRVRFESLTVGPPIADPLHG
ncbi:DUF1349 domain-containing protein [Consotaella aegiceratis]|uniref:DUF1349 domain-containing protein n=1 Tax=Consotaella aegiceratis TaxID=3097961 RepID=UPI002F3E8C81